jgi:site-specific DNA-adenine methylase
MISYYGSKSKIVDYYPPPKYTKIIEPFAGSAKYSLKYWWNDVLLIDKYKIIIDIWKYLQNSSKKDILSLPKMKKGDTVSNYNLSEVEKNFLGFLITRGVESPRKNVSSFVVDIKPKLISIANNIHKIKHWRVKLLDYTDIINQSATWFIDPPYQFGGEYYIESSKKINYNNLADWCKSRKGQVIVCENSKATWLPFKKMISMNGSKHNSIESIWSNLETNYDYQQKTIFD